MKLPASVAFSAVYSYFGICGALGLSDHGAARSSYMVWMCTGRVVGTGNGE